MLVRELTRLLSRAEINVGFEITSLLLQVFRDLLQTLADHLLLSLSKLAQVVRDSLEFFLDPLLQVSLELLGLNLNEAPTRLAKANLLEGSLPRLELLEHILDRLNIVERRVFGLPGLESEFLVELVDHAAPFERVNLLSEPLEVLSQVVKDGRLGIMVRLGLLHDGSEARALVIDQSMNEDVEFRMDDDSGDLFSDSLHVSQDLLSVSDEVCLARLENHSITVVREVQVRQDVVLAHVLVHLGQNHLDRLLVDTDLSLDDHVINESDESSKVIVIALGQINDTLLQLLLLLHQIHGLVLQRLAEATFHVLFLFEVARLSDLLDQILQYLIDDLVNTATIVMLRCLSIVLLLRIEVDDLEDLGLVGDPERQSALHVVKSLVDLDVTIKERRPSLDERLS